MPVRRKAKYIDTKIKSLVIILLLFTFKRRSHSYSCRRILKSLTWGIDSWQKITSGHLTRTFRSLCLKSLMRFPQKYLHWERSFLENDACFRERGSYTEVIVVAKSLSHTWNCLLEKVAFITWFKNSCITRKSSNRNAECSGRLLNIKVVGITAGNLVQVVKHWR